MIYVGKGFSVECLAEQPGPGSNGSGEFINTLCGKTVLRCTPEPGLCIRMLSWKQAAWKLITPCCCF